MSAPQEPPLDVALVRARVCEVWVLENERCDPEAAASARNKLTTLVLRAIAAGTASDPAALAAELLKEQKR